MRIPHRRPLHKLFNSKQFLKSTPFTAVPKTPSSPTHRLLFSARPSKPISRIHPLDIRTTWICVGAAPSVHLYSPHKSVQMEVLRRKLEEFGIYNDLCTPGQHRILCPQCKGGDSCEKTLALLIASNCMCSNSAVWNCFWTNCGWKGCTQYADSKSGSMIQNPKVKHKREITEKSLELELLCAEILDYFAERKISGETLRRNCVMQRKLNDKIVIAFTYRRNGALVSCKYRDVNRKFWQEKDTEKIFYGFDDISNTSDIIIVEGEVDKLAMEEAGFRNCVSVPDGAPLPVSTKEFFQSEGQDTKYQYLWNCKEYLEKASRIILATDGDRLGQALAEELARRLGRERCWQVRWPKNFKDANEVLMFMGPDALKKVIEKAELYPIRGLFNFKDDSDEIDAYHHRNVVEMKKLNKDESNSQCGGSSKGTKRKDLMIDLFEKDIEAIGSGINKVAEAIEKGNLVSERGLEIAAKIVAIAEKARADCHSDKEVYAELINIGVPDYIQLDAFLFLLNSSQHKSAFFGVPSERRLELPYKMMMR